MSMYQHVAECNPDGSYLVLHKFGYADQPINSIDDIAYHLQNMVASEGEPALKEILKIHPDRDVIIEHYQSTQKKEQPKAEVLFHDGCGCDDCKKKAMKNATGDAPKGVTLSQTNLFILLGAVLVTVAIISKK